MQVEDEDAVVVHLGREEGEGFGWADGIVGKEIVRVDHAAATLFVVFVLQRERMRSAALGRHDADDLSPAVEHQRHEIGLAEGE